MSPIVDLLAASVLLNTAPPQELTLQQVLKANTAAIKAIRSIHVTIEVNSNHPVPGEEKKPPVEALPYITLEWWKDGAHERVRQTWLRGGMGKPDLDVSNGPKGYKALHRYVPNNEPWPPSESSAGRASGELDKIHTDGSLSVTARGMSYMRPFYIGDGTLEEYILKYPSKELAATPATSKFGCYEITTVEKKSRSSGSIDVRDVRVFVDPKAGFWIRRIEKGPWQKSADPGDKGTLISEVKEFKNCGNGIFWPLRIDQSTRLPGHDIGLDFFVRHTLHSINQPLPEEDFEVRFPDWLVVHDKTTGQVFIWGPEDKPRMTFASQAEFIEWNKGGVEAGAHPRTRWMWLTGISIFVGLMLSFIILWRRKTAHVAGGIVQSVQQTSSDENGKP